MKEGAGVTDTDMQDWYLLDTLDSEAAPEFGEVLKDGRSQEEDQEPVDTSYLPQLKAGRVNSWDPRLIIDLNLALDPVPEILERYGLTGADLESMMGNPAFRKDLAVMAREIREDGVSFKRKAATQAEAYLEVLDAIVVSPVTPAGVRHDCIKSVVKWGELEPKESKDTNGTNGAVINVQINF